MSAAESSRAAAARLVQPRPSAGRGGARVRDGLVNLAGLALVLLLWEAWVRIANVPSHFVPAPSGVLQSLWAGLAVEPTARVGFYRHITQTLFETFVGFFFGSALGILLGVAISQFKVVERFLMPYIVAFQSLPKVAVAPLFLIWFGIDWQSKMAIVILITFFPVLVNSIAGMNSVEESKIDLLRSLAASRRQIFFKVIFPSALPFIFAGLEMAAVFSLVGALVGEFIGGTAGLGILLLNRQAALDTAGVFAVYIILSILGITLSQVVQLAKRKFLFWAPSAQRGRTRSVRGPISA